MGDPKKKYTRFEKIGQGLVGAFSFPRKMTKLCVLVYLILLLFCLS